MISIKANELRVGNWVYVNVRVAIPEILELWPTKIELRHFKYMTEGDKQYPIPLTPEILKGCGFFQLLPYKAWGNMKRSVWQTEDGGYVIDRSNEFKYVHQLQNLYFALTGEELTVVLSKQLYIPEVLTIL